jgi:primosomal protein N' (replication factor Y)
MEPTGLFESRRDAARAPGEADGYVRVVVERGMDAPSGAEGLAYLRGEADCEVGERVVVPLGRGDRAVGGVVIARGGEELVGDVAPERLKPIIRATGVRLSGALLDLAQWMAGYYVCPIGLVMSAMLPAAVKRSIGLRIRRLVERAGPLDAGVLKGLSPAARQAAEALDGIPAARFPMDPRALARELGRGGQPAIRRLVERGVLRVVERPEVPRRLAERPAGMDIPEDGAPLVLTAAQAAAVEGIGRGLGSFGVHLLRGVTGSGKTEVYLRLIATALERGLRGLVLVPEIALTPQVVARFQARFQTAGVAILHSGLTATERHRQWLLARSGAAKVVVGARSAVFAPLDPLGLIVVDEEHEPTYKQDQAPRYHARDTAIKRAQIEGCLVVLGSATPSLESYGNALAARYRLWTLPERVAGWRLPAVRVVDMGADWRGGGKGPALGVRRSIGPTLAAELRRTLDAGGQAILLLNRRGYASFVACPDQRCGWSLGCEHCDVRMVLHVGQRLPLGEALRCHHCRAEQVVPRVCPLCGRGLSRLGTGTQRVEEELEELFPGPGAGALVRGRSLLRLDSDAAGSAADVAEALTQFGRGEARVLLGTQMVGKGLDFPNVRLVGIISADTALAIPDFRASERTFQLVAQVAGRAGRGEAGGRVIVQTLAPEQRAIELASRHDYETFAREELEIRRRAGLPPAARMARVVVRDADGARADREAEAVARALREAIEPGSGVELAGPMPCVIARIGGEFRREVVLTAPAAGALHRALEVSRRAGALARGGRVVIDVDPLWLL